MTFLLTGIDFNFDVDFDMNLFRPRSARVGFLVGKILSKFYQRKIKIIKIIAM